MFLAVKDKEPHYCKYSCIEEFAYEIEFAFSNSDDMKQKIRKPEDENCDYYFYYQISFFHINMMVILFKKLTFQKKLYDIMTFVTT